MIQAVSSFATTGLAVPHPFVGALPEPGRIPMAPSCFSVYYARGNTLTRIDGNHITNLDLSFRDPTSPNWYFFMGISIAGGNVELGAQEGNYIGSDTSDPQYYFPL